jgi:hypothetical protein
MKSLVRVSLGVLVVGALFAFAGCSDDDSGDDAAGGAAQGGTPAQGEGGASAGAVECEVIGELCHEADSGSGTAHDCHETGHEGKVAACAAAFDGCVSACVVDEGEGGGPGSKQDTHCAALGELCHEVDDGDGPLHDCHEVGHVGNAAKCAAEFGHCATLCLAARELLEAGEGGVGGTGAGGHAHSGGGEASSNGGMTSAGGAAAGGAGG